MSQRLHAAVAVTTLRKAWSHPLVPAILAGFAFLLLVLVHGPQAGQATAAAAPVVREFNLVAQETDWDIFPGTTVKAWTYNGQIPGPEIRITEGDVLRVNFTNRLPAPTAIHWHGVDVPNAMDGVPGLTQDAVPPGGAFTYEFVATNPGTRWYHTHQDPETQTHLGLYGSLIVEPRTPPPGSVKYDREYTYMLSEWSLALTPDVALGNTSFPRTGPGSLHSKEMDFDFFLMNGKAGDSILPVNVKQGERIRIRLVNAGSLIHVMHTHGHSFKIVATDGNFVPPANQLVKDSVMLGPSERVDIEIEAKNPGVWLFHCHVEPHMANGMMTTIQYDGVPAPLASHAHLAVPAPAGDAAVVAAASAPAPLANEPGTDNEPPDGLAVQPVHPDATGPGVPVRVLDNRYDPANLTVPVGTTVTWTSAGSNLHTVSSLNGLFESGTLTPGGAYSYTFGQPGTYRIYCRQHLLNGMLSNVVVQ